MVQKSLEDVFKRYNKASKQEKVDMVFNIITQNHIPVGELNICFNIVFVNNSVPATPLAVAT